MLLQVFVTPVSAQSQGYKDNEASQSSEGAYINDHTQVFKFENKNRNIKPRSLQSARPFTMLYSRQSTGAIKTEKATITMETLGLGDNDPFDWTVFGDSESFIAWIGVQYEGETSFIKASDDITIDAINASNKIEDIDVSVDSSKTVKYYAIFTQYSSDADRFKIRADFAYPDPISKGLPLDFKLTVTEMVSTKMEYSYIDEYKELTKEDKPVTNLKGLGKFGTIDFDVKTEGEDVLWKEKKLYPLDYGDKNIKLTLAKNEFTESGIKYLLTSSYNYKTGGKITIQRQKDVVVPRINDEQSGPIEQPNNYKRLILMLMNLTIRAL